LIPHLAISEQQLKRFCQAQHIRRLSLFGSTLAGNARPDSDIDLLVEFEPGWEPGLLGLATMEAEMAALLGGKKVDLRTPQDLSRHFRDQVLRTAEVQYAG
jgi:predicted nucleotidyltransferase